MAYEDFHIVATKSASDRLAELLRIAGLRIDQRIIDETGRPEYVIAVDTEDIDRARLVLDADIGLGRTFKSDGNLRN